METKGAIRQLSNSTSNLNQLIVYDLSRVSYCYVSVTVKYFSAIRQTVDELHCMDTKRFVSTCLHNLTVKLIQLASVTCRSHIVVCTFITNSTHRLLSALWPDIHRCKLVAHMVLVHSLTVTSDYLINQYVLNLFWIEINPLIIFYLK